MAKRKGDNEAKPGAKRHRTESPEHDPHVEGDEKLTRTFRTAVASLYVAVAPAYQNDPLRGVRAQHLDPMVLVHSDKLGGVVIAYDQLELLGPEDDGSEPPAPGLAAGLIINDGPFAFLWVRARFLLWHAEHGDTLEGWISMQSSGHISLLVHDAFNATISRQYLPDGWSFEQVDDDETSGTPGGYWRDEQNNRIMGRLRFTVRSVKAAARLVHIRGSLIEGQEPTPLSLSEPAPKSKHRTFDEDSELVSGSTPAEEDKDNNESTNNSTSSSSGSSENSESEESETDSKNRAEGDKKTEAKRVTFKSDDSEALSHEGVYVPRSRTQTLDV